MTNTNVATHERLSRRTVHHIADTNMAHRRLYDCGVTERHVQTRSGGASADWSRVTCAACLAHRTVDEGGV